MSRHPAAALLLLAMTASPAFAFTARDLAAEEGRFAAYSVKHGMRDAFVEFFAANSVLLRPDPVNGRDYMKTQQDPPIVLDWKSTLAVLSSSGDLGMSTGPSVVNSKTDPKAPTSYGQFFSVWEKQADGGWKVLLDHGIGHGTTAAPEKALVAIDLAAPTKASADDPEKAFAARTSTAGLAAAYGEAATAETRAIRAGRVPLEGRAAIEADAAAAKGKWAWQELQRGQSKADDFRWSLGTYQAEGGEGHYIRVWTRDPRAHGGRWVLSGEVVTPRPPKRT